MARFPLRTLSLIFALGLVGQILFYVIPVQMPFYLETQTRVSATLIGGALASRQVPVGSRRCSTGVSDAL